jgi:hypothetical protein
MTMSKERDFNGYFLSCWLSRVIKIMYCWQTSWRLKENEFWI